MKEQQDSGMEDKQSSDLIKVAIALLDLGLITAAFYLAYWLRFGGLEGVDSFIWLYYLSAPLILFLLLRYGVLTGFRYQPLRDICASTAMAFAVAGVVSSTVLYLSKTTDYSRLVFSSYFVLATIFVLGVKIFVKKTFDTHLRRGGMNIRIAMVGFGTKFDEILAELREHPQWGIAPVVVIDPQSMEVNTIVKVIRDSVIDEVYIVYPRSPEYHQQIDELLIRLENLGLPIRVALNFDELENYYGQHACMLANRDGVMLAPYNLDPDQLILKRCTDLLGGVIGLFITIFITPILALIIKIESPGPIFFSQERIGKSGRPFRIYKFRSMFFDAEETKHKLAEHNIYEGPIFKVVNDPRVTRVGRVIRKYSLDEFPQFWNVLKGDMSLVGTRPPTPDEVDRYQDHHFRRISIRPGLTGQWQAMSRNEARIFDDVVAHDLEYIKSWSLMLDAKIILKTIGIMLLPGKNAGI